MLHLWGATTSRTLRAAWALHELSLDYVAHPILPRTGETKTAEFTRINPRQKIPVLQDGDFTIVLFGHRNWREPVEFMAHCSMKWAVFMLSLRELVETGRGRPSPNDVKIDNWN